MSLLSGCKKEEITKNAPAIDFPSTYTLIRVDSAAVDIYTKNGKVTGPNAHKLGGSLFYYSHFITTFNQIDFLTADTAIVSKEVKIAYTPTEHFKFKYKPVQAEGKVQLLPYKPFPMYALDPKANDGYKLLNDHNEIMKHSQLVAEHTADSVLVFHQYNEIFSRRKWNGTNFNMYTRNDDQDKQLYPQFAESDTLWIMKKTYYLKKKPRK